MSGFAHFVRDEFSDRKNDSSTTTTTTTAPFATSTDTSGGGLFHGATVCPLHSAVAGSSHTPMKWISVACLGVTALVSLALMVRHFRHYNAPREQRQIIRIAFTPFVMALISCIALLSYDAAPYVLAIEEVWDSIALASLFLLLVNMSRSSPGGDHEAQPKTWLSVFQIVIVMPIILIVQDATQAANVYCVGKLSVHFSNLWITIFKMLSEIICVLAILNFYKSIKPHTQVRRGVWKLACFKLIIALSTVQQLIINILINQNAAKPGPTFSYTDLQYGLPAVLTAVESVLFALSFHYAYSPGEYSADIRGTSQHLSFPAAVFNSMNPTDLIHGLVHSFTGGRTGPFPATQAYSAKEDTRWGRLSSQPQGQGQGQGYDSTYGAAPAAHQPAAYYGTDPAPPPFQEAAGHPLSPGGRRNGGALSRSPSPSRRLREVKQYV